MKPQLHVLASGLVKHALPINEHYPGHSHFGGPLCRGGCIPITVLTGDLAADARCRITSATDELRFTHHFGLIGRIYWYLDQARAASSTLISERVEMILATFKPAAASIARYSSSV